MGWMFWNFVIILGVSTFFYSVASYQISAVLSGFLLVQTVASLVKRKKEGKEALWPIALAISILWLIITLERVIGK